MVTLNSIFYNLIIKEKASLKLHKQRRYRRTRNSYQPSFTVSIQATSKTPSEILKIDLMPSSTRFVSAASSPLDVPP